MSIPMKFNLLSGGWWCRHCSIRWTLLADIIFSEKNIKPHLVLQAFYFFLRNVPFGSIAAILGISEKSTYLLMDDFKQLLLEDAEIACSEEKIGGPGIIVEIDESKFGKRKYNRGHLVEGQWVLGGVERTEARRIFLVSVERRNAETLLSIIKEKVAPGSIIHTDCWAAYGGIPSLVDDDGNTMNFQHHTVNHSLHFRDPITRVHTNTIEGTWNGIKISLFPKGYSKKNIDASLNAFIWKRKFKGQRWGRIVHILKTTYFPLNYPRGNFIDIEN